MVVLGLAWVSVGEERGFDREPLGEARGLGGLGKDPLGEGPGYPVKEYAWGVARACWGTELFATATATATGVCEGVGLAVGLGRVVGALVPAQEGCRVLPGLGRERVGHEDRGFQIAEGQEGLGAQGVHHGWGDQGGLEGRAVHHGWRGPEVHHEGPGKEVHHGWGGQGGLGAQEVHHGRQGGDPEGLDLEGREQAGEAGWRKLRSCWRIVWKACLMAG